MRTIIKLRISVFVLLLGMAFQLQAQQDPNYTTYMYSMQLLNPAFTGAGEKATVGLNIRNQWANVEGAPQTQSFYYDQNAGKNVGLGLTVVNDKTFVEKQTNVAANFSYKVQAGSDAMLYFGLRTGLYTYSVNEQGLVSFGFGTDPLAGNFNNRMTFNVGVGAYLKLKDGWLSLSAPTLLGADRLNTSNNNEVTVSPNRINVLFAGGYSFALSDKFKFKPSTQLRYTDATPISWDITGLFSLEEQFEFGINYRIDEAIGGLIGLRLDEWLVLGASYMTPADSDLGDTGGTTEFFLRFEL